MPVHPLCRISGSPSVRTLRYSRVIWRREWCRWRDLNPRPPAYEADALPLSYTGHARRVNDPTRERKLGAAPARRAGGPRNPAGSFSLHAAPWARDPLAGRSAPEQTLSVTENAPENRFAPCTYPIRLDRPHPATIAVLPCRLMQVRKPGRRGHVCPTPERWRRAARPSERRASLQWKQSPQVAAVRGPIVARAETARAGSAPPPGAGALGALARRPRSGRFSDKFRFLPARPGQYTSGNVAGRLRTGRSPGCAAGEPVRHRESSASAACDMRVKAPLPGIGRGAGERVRLRGRPAVRERE